jgi:hypothetical protein
MIHYISAVVEIGNMKSSQCATLLMNTKAAMRLKRQQEKHPRQQQSKQILEHEKDELPDASSISGGEEVQTDLDSCIVDEAVEMIRRHIQDVITSPPCQLHGSQKLRQNPAFLRSYIAHLDDTLRDIWLTWWKGTTAGKEEEEEEEEEGYQEVIIVTKEHAVS